MTHGGKRPGAGRPKGRKTDTISFRVPMKLKQRVRKRHGKSLNEKAIQWMESLLQ